MSVEEKQARSFYTKIKVGNIPHGTTEEQMKDIFNTAGTVLSFRIVYDRETGNPKGYGFAEYLDIEMAQSAIRNLNGYEFSGRTLRVDKASSQADELRMIHAISGGPPIENPYGENISPDKAPEAISRAVASLPPEQMYELMKQMKLCIQNNMNEARTMLLNNPQLAYALLQAQVVMKIVEPQVAMALLHRKPDQIPPIMPSNTSPIQLQQNIIRPVMIGQPQPLLSTVMPLMPVQPPPLLATTNIRAPPSQQPLPQQIRPGFDPLMDPRYQTSSVPSRPSGTTNQPRTLLPAPSSQPSGGQQQQQSSAQQSNVAQNQSSSNSKNESSQISNVDQEKAALIMQVLQLTEEQIAMLPPEQRQSILMLKEQIAQSAGGLMP